MKQLLILRHAKSSWKDGELDDHDRPLNKRGRRDAPRIGRWIAAKGLIPDQILSSTARRARQTAKRVAKASGHGAEPTLIRELYLADPRECLNLLSELAGDPRSVMIVGHNPGLEELLTLLTGRDELLPTAALAHVELPVGRWSELNASTRGRLVDLWRPRELPESS